MIIHTFGGQASIMGKDTGFLYDGKASELRIQGITFDDAQRLLALLEGSPAAVASTVAGSYLMGVGGGGGGPAHASNGAYAAIPAPGTTGVVNAGAQMPSQASPAPGGGKAPLAVDPARMAVIAAGSPAKEAKPEKETKPKKAKAEEAPPAPAAEAAPEDAPPPPPPPAAESATKVTASKATNGTAAPAKATAPASDVPQVLVDARKLRDVLTQLLDLDKIPFGEPGSTEREQAVDHLKKRCAELKTAVPCLSRIADVDARIDRTVEVMDMGEEIS